MLEVILHNFITCVRSYVARNLSVVNVSFNSTVVRDDESAGSLTFILVTNRPANVSFTVQVCTEDVDLGPDLGMATGIHCMQHMYIAYYYSIL